MMIIYFNTSRNKYDVPTHLRDLNFLTKTHLRYLQELQLFVVRPPMLIVIINYYGEWDLQEKTSIY